MHTFSQYDQLLTKYLLNELDAAEEEDLLLWLDSSPANRDYLEKFAAAWNLSSAPQTIRDIDVDQEWEKYRMNMDNSGTVIRMHTARSGSATSSTYKKWWKFPAIAVACVLVVIALYLMKTGNKTSETGPAETGIVTTSGPRLSPSQLQTVTNRSAVARTLTLIDGSSVILYPNSELIYDSLFSGDERNVLLRGKADFKVAANKSKPFIVTHGNIATLVLGTRFTVWAPVKEKTQRIRLYEGKVMIRAANNISKLRGSYYLTPGQEFVYDELHNTGQVRAFGTTPSVAAGAASDKNDKEDITLPDHSKGTWFMFNNQPLSEVFEELQSVYNVRIVYKETDLHKMYFIGKFDASDSLHVILSRMATLYHLKIIREQDKYIISK